ncbi:MULTISPECIES: STT3 domain-containing protein [unclassified Campylobacter]|uniref:STT3 domain-containing protein n=1 Tax=unclassified Campylobacter TaxID=2593542 RepID=UPI0022E99DC4|nr:MULTISPECIES: STT3 domain-containing protein [unclassified Campylobacter]MDA3054206.1 general glycosylation pathway protein [Campylobacter sp. VBCF_07 NA4]MDA3060897.1 general glycosylation pathway protein [Campylobacter sp. VBCF_02 NA5]MDA3070410.1 general glycosylation pathway protein [Campylobacter sp. VBCF_08 NA3]WBR53719.1 general glycosylation pathway protein [Campylobacter sp. VBCF_01 NA2]
MNNSAQNTQNGANLPQQKGGVFKFIKNFELSKHLLILIVLAYGVSVIFRLYWVQWASEYSHILSWNNQIMINTNDGYAFAEGTRDYLAGFHQQNDLSYIDFPLAKLTALLAQITPFSLETLFLYMPVVFSSLIVVPILLISAEFRALRAGFIGALVACVANSYYNRTMAGYYDTDMLNIVLPMFILWAFIRVCTKGDARALFFTGAFGIFYLWWYPSSFSLNAMMLGALVLYTLIFARKNLVNYEAIIIFLLAICFYYLYIKILLFLAIFYLFAYKKEIVNFRILLGVGILVFAIFVYCGGLNPIIFQAKFYIFRSLADNPDTVFHFFNVNQTIQESGLVPKEVFMRRISSSVIVFVVACVGYAVLCFRHKEFLLSLPLLLLGFAANKAGLRFTIYAVGVMGLSFGYILYFSVKRLNLPKFAGRIILLALTILALYPAWQHIKAYTVETVFFKSEVEVLDKLKTIADREDYALAWWDYGYVIRYYSDVKTLVDGGKHLGNDNYPVSFALLADQYSSAHMARVDVEYTERNFTEKFPNKIKQILADYKLDDFNAFLLNLSLPDFKTPTKTRDIYYVLPDRMMSILSTVSQFSNIDITTGKMKKDKIFIASERFWQDESGITMDNGIKIANNLLSIEAEGNKFPINTFFETSHNASGKLEVKEIKVDSSAQFSIIYMKDYGRFLLLDREMLNSTYIQLFVLERYKSDLFEPVVISPAVKVYRLKK